MSHYDYDSTIDCLVSGQVWHRHGCRRWVRANKRGSGVEHVELPVELHVELLRELHVELLIELLIELHVELLIKLPVELHVELHMHKVLCLMIHVSAPVLTTYNAFEGGMAPRYPIIDGTE